jgi:hypothetical protein
MGTERYAKDEILTDWAFQTAFFSLNEMYQSEEGLIGVKIAKTLLPNYFFIPGTSVPALPAPQNSISFNQRTTGLPDLQSIKQCFANRVSEAVMKCHATSKTSTL